MRRRSNVTSTIETYARQHRSALNGPEQALWAELRGYAAFLRDVSPMNAKMPDLMGRTNEHRASGSIRSAQACAWTRTRDPAVNGRLLWCCPAPCSARPASSSP
jgi:hypothetical protein